MNSVIFTLGCRRQSLLANSFIENYCCLVRHFYLTPAQDLSLHWVQDTRADLEHARMKSSILLQYWLPPLDNCEDDLCRNSILSVPQPCETIWIWGLHSEHVLCAFCGNPTSDFRKPDEDCLLQQREMRKSASYARESVF